MLQTATALNYQPLAPRLKPAPRPPTHSGAAFAKCGRAARSLLASREPMKAAFYDSDLWKKELEGVLMPMLEKYDVVLVDDPQGLIRW